MNKSFTAADVYKAAMENTSEGFGYPKFRYPELLETFSRDGKSVSAKSIGKQLIKDIGRRSGDYHVEFDKDPVANANRYRVAGPNVAGDSEMPKDEEF